MWVFKRLNRKQGDDLYRTLAAIAFICFTLGIAPLRAEPQSTAKERPRTCSADSSMDDGRASYAEPRSQTLAQSALNKIRPSVNGGVIIHGADRSDVLVHACVHSSAPSDQEARALAAQVTIAQGPGEIEGRGPKTDHDRSWSVSYEIWVPKHSNLDVASVNGGIAVESVDGDVQAENVNGGIRLSDLSGNVKGSTVNGGIKAELAGASWTGGGLRISTTNGGVRLEVPGNYSARVETSTVNGGFHCDFPISIEAGEMKHLSFQLGNGGPEIRTSTVNGGIHIVRKS
jgi:DUF4097 and DUF4098 domain-containing protein YvlB